MNKVAVALMAASLAACQSTGHQAGSLSNGASTPVLAQSQIEPIVVANKSRLWRDPYSLRDASVSRVQGTTMDASYVCVEVNAKNGFGGYIGMRTYMIFAFADGTANATDAGLVMIGRPCNGFKSFPALNGGG